MGQETGNSYRLSGLRQGSREKWAREMLSLNNLCKSPSEILGQFLSCDVQSTALGSLAEKAQPRLQGLNTISKTGFTPES